MESYSTRTSLPHSTTCRGLDGHLTEALLAAALALAELACGGPRRESEAAPAVRQQEVADAGAPSRPPRERASQSEPPAPRAPAGTEPLAVQEFLPALVSWPEAKTWPQPVLVAVHGAGDHAEAHCALWRGLLGRRGIVLCLRGRPIAMDSEARGYFFADHHSLKREAVAALEALERSYPSFADTSGVVYAGYSQGAQMGLSMLADQGARAPRLLLVEGGAGDWSAQRSASFFRSGGRAVALVCGTRGCNKSARRSHQRLTAAGVRVTTHYVPGAGHTYLGSVVPILGEAFVGLTKDDQRWVLADATSADGAP